MIQCPSCGGALRFDIESQQMKCDSCSSLFDPYQFDYGNGAEEETEYNVTIYRCPACGGEITSTDETAAGFCSYCGSSTILEGRLSKEKKPQFIIPFKQTKEQCQAAFEKCVKRAVFAPKSFRTAGKAESFRGIYMPYWLYDMSQKGSISVKSSTSHRSGDYIITNHYVCSGNLDNCYNGVSYDASSSFADDISTVIAPYNVKDVTKFSPSFLSGYYADLADVPGETYIDTAKELAQESTYNYLKQKSPMAKEVFDEPKETVKMRIQTNVDVTRSAMFPVWFMAYRNRDRVAYATVNGQTGKVHADIPMSIPKCLLLGMILAAIIFTVFQLTLTILPDVLMLVIAILGLISVLSYGSELKKIVAKENHEYDIGMQYKEEQIEKKKMARVQAQKGASFGEVPSDSYVVTQNDIKRSKREIEKKKKAERKGTVSLVSVVSLVIVVMVLFSVFGSILTSVTGNIFQTGEIIKVAALAAGISLMISLFSVKNAWRNIRLIKTDKRLPASVFSAIGLLLVLIVSIWNPANDMIYYGAAFVSMLGVIINVLGIISSHNLLAMRPLPQFEMYQGGDDRA